MSWEASAWARKQEGLDPTAKLLLLLLADHADEHGVCWPSVPKLAAETGVSERSVQRHLANLEGSRTIRRIPRYREDGSQTSNGYRILLTPPVTPASWGGDNLSPPPVTICHPMNLLSRNLLPPISPPEGDTLKEVRKKRLGVKIEGEPDFPDFLRVWNELPKRAGSDSKRNAFVKWRARIKEGVDMEEMVEGAKRYARHCDARGKTGTELAMRGETFFGPGAHWENEWE